MNHPYTSVHMETRQAKQRLIQVFDGRRGPSLVEIEEASGAHQQKRVTDRPWLSRELTLTLLLSGTIAAANADQPLFWLLIGPTPLAIGLATAVFLRPRFDLSACLLALRKR
jgi:hypothetical protein